MQSILLMKAPYNLRQFGAKINHLDILIFFVKWSGLAYRENVALRRNLTKKSIHETAYQNTK